MLQRSEVMKGWHPFLKVCKLMQVSRERLLSHWHHSVWKRKTKTKCYSPLCNHAKSFNLITAAPSPSPLLHQVYITLQKFVWICTRPLCTNHELLWLPLAWNSEVWPVSCRSSHVHIFHHQHHCSHWGAQRWQTTDTHAWANFVKLVFFLISGLTVSVPQASCRDCELEEAASSKDALDTFCRSDFGEYQHSFTDDPSLPLCLFVII